MLGRLSYATANAPYPNSIGVSSYPSDIYFDQIQYIEELLKASPSGALDPVISDFANFCREGQSPQNKVEWNLEKGMRRISFGCFQAHDLDHGKAITFKINSEGQLVEATKSEIHIKIEKCKKRPTLYVAQSLTIGLGYIAGGVLAQKVLNDGGDKVLHGGMSSANTLLFGSILYSRFNLSPSRAATYGAIASCTLGFLKEATDPMFGRVRDSGDNKANLIGCAVGWVLTYTLNEYIGAHQEKFYRAPDQGQQCRH